MQSVIALPSLDDIACNPTRARELAPDTLAMLLARCGAAQGALLAALVCLSGQGSRVERSDIRLLTVDEASAKLGVTREWLYRRGKRLGLAVKLGDGTLRFSSSALDAYIKGQTISAVPGRRRAA
jgi:predicted DNA-binding transcriptional regulator AlpA